MTQVINITDDLKNPNVEILKYNENGDTHEKLDKQAVIEKIERQKEAVSIAESLKEYTWEERFEWMHQRKLKGNRLFNKKKFDQAIQIYLETFMGLDLKAPEEKVKRQQIELQIPCMLNLSSCLKQKKEYAKAVDLCDKAIALNENHVTSYLRRGMLYHTMKDYEKAMKDFKICKDKGVDDVALENINKAIEDIKNAQGKEKQKYKKFFEEGGLTQDGIEDEATRSNTAGESNSSVEIDTDDEPKILYYNDDLEELSQLGVLKYVAYPFKKSYKFTRDKLFCCRRKNTSYDVVETEAYSP